MLSDAELTKRISARLKGLRLKQNISRQDMAVGSGVSMSSIARMEDGEIKSFESFLRIIRTLGKVDIFEPLLQEDELRPSERFKLAYSAGKKQRKRASKSSSSSSNIRQGESEW